MTTTIATTTTLEATTTVIATTIAPEARCQAGLDDLTETVGLVLDRIDANPTGFMEDDNDELGKLFTDLGALIGTECHTMPDFAYSELLVYMAGEANSRPLLTSAFIEGFLEGLCANELGMELTLQARAACTATP